MEFALCATVFFMIVFGLLKVAVIYGDYTALQHAARDGSRKGSVTRGTGDANAVSVANAVTTAVQTSNSILDPSKMGITVTGLDSNVAPDGTLWEAHDRDPGDGHLSLEARRHRRDGVVGHDVEHDPGDHRVAGYGCRRSCGQRTSSLLRPVSGTSSARQSAVSTAACSAPASQSRSATRRASASSSARTASRALERSARGSASLEPSTRTRTGPSSACTSTVEPGRGRQHGGWSEARQGDAPGLPDEPAHGTHRLDGACAHAGVGLDERRHVGARDGCDAQATRQLRLEQLIADGVARDGRRRAFDLQELTVLTALAVECARDHAALGAQQRRRADRRLRAHEAALEQRRERVRARDAGGRERGQLRGRERAAGVATLHGRREIDGARRVRSGSNPGTPSAGASQSAGSRAHR